MRSQSIPRCMLGVAFVLVVGATALSAHDKFKIVGTVVKVHHAQLDVKAIDGQIYEIDMDETTPITRDHKKADRSELRAGTSVVVHALGHDLFDLEAVEVQLVPRPPGQ